MDSKCTFCAKRAREGIALRGLRLCPECEARLAASDPSRREYDFLVRRVATALRTKARRERRGIV